MPDSERGFRRCKPIVAAMPFISAGMVTFKYETSDAKIPEQGTTEYELLVTSGTRMSTDLETVRAANRKASGRFRFAQKWFTAWLGITLANALTIMVAILSQ